MAAHNRVTNSAGVANAIAKIFGACTPIVPTASIGGTLAASHSTKPSENDTAGESI